MLIKYNIQLKEHYEHTQPIGENNYALIYRLISQGQYTSDELKAINQCRVHLQAQNLSDIVNSQWTHISTCIINHICDLDWVSSYKWLHQPRPSPSDWKLWNKSLTHTWERHDLHILPTPLDHWTRSPHFHLPWSLHQLTNYLYYKVSPTTFNI